MQDAPVFWITFSFIPETLMLPDHAAFAKINVFKAFFGFWQGNTLIQHNILRIPGFFVQNRVDIPILCQQAALAHHLLTLWRTVTACVPVLRPGLERCTMKQVFWLVEPMWNRGICPQINQYDQSRKVCRLKRLCWKTHNLWGHRPTKSGESH